MEDIFKELVGKTKLSKVKLLILERLWQEGKNYPKGWVTSSELLKLTNQKYFDRRIRELKNEAGFDIETKSVGGEHCYRLASNQKEEESFRTYLSAAQKKALFEAAGYRCAICGQQTSAGVIGLQADHKVPLSRGGSDVFENWQPVCHQCNVSKRKMCQGCALDCQGCGWAFPESKGSKVLINLPPELRRYIEADGTQSNSMEKKIINALKKHFLG
jgi:5-methylcytosine-specific restriction endonuclease McrA